MLVLVGCCRPLAVGQRVTFMELFFDLVYVVAVTQLSQLLLQQLSIHCAGQTLLLVAVWSAWIYNAWLTSWFDPDRQVVRLALLAVMLVSLVMSATLPEAFSKRGLLFAGAYLAIQGGRSFFAVAVLRAEPRLRGDVQRIQNWLVASAMLWLAGGLAHGTVREVLWLAAVDVDLGPPAGSMSRGWAVPRRPTGRLPAPTWPSGSSCSS